jgi:four helix bundle protein
MKENVILNKSKQFAINSISLYKDLLQNKEYVLSKQFFRSATSIGANINEATAGYSKKDFAAKMSIASKEARECLYWIEIIESSGFSNLSCSELKLENEELIRILTAIVKTCQTPN